VPSGAVVCAVTAPGETTNGPGHSCRLAANAGVIDSDKTNRSGNERDMT